MCLFAKVTSLSYEYEEDNKDRDVPVPDFQRLQYRRLRQRLNGLGIVEGDANAESEAGDSMTCDSYVIREFTGMSEFAEHTRGELERGLKIEG